MKSLERAIEAAPDDPAPYLVYADWLQTNSDPRGPLITLQHAGAAKSPAAAKARAAAKQHLEKHADALLGPLAKYPPGAHLLGVILTWRYGFLHEVELDHETPSGKAFNAMKCLAEVLAHPSARFLRVLKLHRLDAKSNDYRPAVKLVAAQRRPTLARLHIDPMGELGPKKSILGDLEALWASCPNLEVLELNGNDVAFGALKLPKLQTLRTDGRNLSKQAVASICAAKLPALTDLSIRPGDVGATVTVDDLRPILARASRLTKLSLVEIPDTDTLCELLARSKIAAQLEELSVEISDMTDKGALALAGRAGGWPKLATLYAGHTQITKVGKQALKSICRAAKV